MIHFHNQAWAFLSGFGFGTAFGIQSARALTARMRRECILAALAHFDTLCRELDQRLRQEQP